MKIQILQSVLLFFLFSPFDGGIGLILHFHFKQVVDTKTDTAKSSFTKRAYYPAIIFRKTLRTPGAVNDR
jgi:hypothetical protein